jgi:hypothetical protein
MCHNMLQLYDHRPEPLLLLLLVVVYRDEPLQTDRQL